VFITQHLGLGADDFAWQFVPSVGGIFFGALAVNRLAGRTSIQQQARIGFGLLLGAALFNVVYHLFMPPALPWSVLPLFFYTFGMSMVAPGATLLVMDLFPAIRGIAASCQSCAMTVLASAVSGLLAPLLWDSVLYLAAGQLALTGIALCLWIRAGVVRRRLAGAPGPV
jgi:DHA1 family bicyclomycin/chloramphenicol resistance-like MFS transporter